MTQAISWESLEFLLRAARWTVAMSLIAFVGGGSIGIVLALARVLAPKPVRLLLAALIQLVQATPLLVVILLSYFGLSAMGYDFPPLIAAGLSLVVFSSVYLAEIWRGCIESIPRQQWEAAEALGLGTVQKLRYVILPQALRISAPPTVGFLVQIIKNSSVTSLIGFVELTRAGQLLSNATFAPFAVFFMVAAVYFALCFPLSLLSQRLDRKYHAR